MAMASRARTATSASARWPVPCRADRRSHPVWKLRMPEQATRFVAGAAAIGFIGSDEPERPVVWVVARS